MNKYMLILFGGTFFTAFSQLLLKQSANRKYSHPIYEYLNWRVITAYGIFGGVLLLNTYAFTGVDMKYGSVIDTFSYVFVMLLSYIERKVQQREIDWKSDHYNRYFYLYFRIKDAAGFM